MNKLRFSKLVGLAVCLLSCTCTRNFSGPTEDKIDPGYPFGECKMIQLEDGYTSEVLECYISRTNLFPNAPEIDGAFLAIAENYYYRKEYASSLYYLEIIERRFPESKHFIKRLLLKSKISIVTGQYPAAETTLSAIANIALGENRRAYFILLEELSRRTGKAIEAILAMVELERLSENRSEKNRYRVSLTKRIDKLDFPGLSDLEKKLSFTQKDDGLLEQIKRRKIEISIDGTDRKLQSDLCKDYLLDYPDRPFAEDAKKIASKIIAIKQVDPGKIGVLLPLSGRFATYGISALKSLLLAVKFFDKESNEHLPVLIVRDTEGEVAGLDTIMKELVYEHKVIAIIGPIRSTVAEHAAKLADQYQVPLFSLSQQDDTGHIGEQVFSIGITKTLQVKKLVTYCRKNLGIEHFAIFYPRHNYGMDFMHAFWDEVERQNGVITGVESYDPANRDFKKGLERLVGKHDPILRSKDICTAEKLRKRIPCHRADEVPPIVEFEALFIPDNHINASYVLPLLFLEDIVAVQVLGPNAWNNDELITRMNPDFLQGVVFSDAFAKSSPSESQRKFIETFEYYFEEQPNLVSVLCYDTINLLISLLAGGKVKTRQDLHNALVKTSNYPGISGKITVDNKGNVDRDLFLYSFDNGAVVSFDPEEKAPSPGEKTSEKKEQSAK